MVLRVLLAVAGYLNIGEWPILYVIVQECRPEVNSKEHFLVESRK